MSDEPKPEKEILMLHQPPLHEGCGCTVVDDVFRLGGACMSDDCPCRQFDGFREYATLRLAPPSFAGDYLGTLPMPTLAVGTSYQADSTFSNRLGAMVAPSPEGLSRAAEATGKMATAVGGVPMPFDPERADPVHPSVVDEPKLEHPAPWGWAYVHEAVVLVDANGLSVFAVDPAPSPIVRELIALAPEMEALLRETEKALNLDGGHDCSTCKMSTWQVEAVHWIGCARAALLDKLDAARKASGGT